MRKLPVDLAILYPGKSLPDVYDPEVPYRLVVSVNYASHFYESDYVAFYDTDMDALTSKMIEPRKGFITKPSYRERTDKKVVLSPGHGIRKDLFFGRDDKLYDKLRRHPSSTGVLAWIAASSALRWHETLHCFGLDLLYEDDCAGQGYSGRSLKRFLSEILWMRLFAKPNMEIHSNAHSCVKEYILTGNRLQEVLDIYD